MFARWSDARVGTGALLQSRETVQLIQALVGKGERAREREVATNHATANHLTATLSTVITQEDLLSGEWETVSGRKSVLAKSGALTHRRSRRSSTDGSVSVDSLSNLNSTLNTPKSIASVTSSENGSASSDQLNAKPSKGWAAILTGQKSSAELTPSEAAAIAAEEAAKEVAVLREIAKREAEVAAWEAAANEERAKQRAVATDKRAAEAKAAAARAVVGDARGKPTDSFPRRNVSPVVDTPSRSLIQSAPPLEGTARPSSGPWASVVSGGERVTVAATEGWRSLVEKKLDAEQAPQVTVTLDGGDFFAVDDKKAITQNKPRALIPAAQLSHLELAPAMPVVRTSKKTKTPSTSVEQKVEIIPTSISPHRASWSGWAVRNPPPKVDLKAEMEAELVVRANTPSPVPSLSKSSEASSAPSSPGKSNKSETKNSGEKKKTKNGNAPPPPQTARLGGAAGGGRQSPSGAAFSPPLPPASPPLQLPGSTRFPQRPFVAPQSPARAPAPETQQPKLTGFVSALEPDSRAALAKRLGNELLDSAHVNQNSQAASTLSSERKAVESLIRSVHQSSQTLFPAASTEVFGSFPTNAWVPGASNVDVALSLPDAQSQTPRGKMDALNLLANALRVNKWVSDVTVVPSALRPLLFVTTHSAHFQTNGSSGSPGDNDKGAPPLPPGPPPSGAAGNKGTPDANATTNSSLSFPLEVHISVKDKSHKGATTVKFLRQAETEYPALSSVLSVQKAWLAKKQLRGVYKGGIGSYSLALLALHALQRKAFEDKGSSKTQEKTQDAEILGSSLLHFLEFYGHDVDLTCAAVVSHPLRPTGKAAKKAAAAVENNGKNALAPEWGVVPTRVPNDGPPIASVGAGGLTVVDPNQPGHNAGGGCFGIAGVQASFREQLSVIVNVPEGESVLEHLTGCRFIV